MDVVALWEAGVPALGCYGSRLSERQAALIAHLWPTEVICAFDMDEAGQKATQRVVDLLGSKFMISQALWEPSEAKDVADLTPERRRQVIDDAMLLLV